MIFTETPVFTRQITQLLPDDEYGELVTVLRGIVKEMMR